MNNAPFLAPCRPAAELLPLLLLAVLAAALLAPAPALAHRVNIFAWLEGGDVVVECGFNRSSPDKNGLSTVFDAVDGKELLQGHTDDAGRFSFPVPQAAREGHGLRIRINAGEGHQNEWGMDASEFSGAAAPTASPAEKVNGTEKTEGAAAPATTAAPSVPAAQAVSGATPDQVRAIVNAALDAKLGPIRRDLAAQVNAGPGIQEIIGGIGWILGLVGIGLYFKGRRG